MPHRIFYIVAKNEKEQHVAGDMRDAPMQKHRREQCEKDRNGRNPKTRQLHLLAGQGIGQDLRVCDDIPPREDLTRNSGVGIGKPKIMTPMLPVDEYEDIEPDEQIIDDGGGPSIPVIVANG